jgi:hypothetical protein
MFLTSRFSRMMLHAGILPEHLPFVYGRVTGIASGAFAAPRMVKKFVYGANTGTILGTPGSLRACRTRWILPTPRPHGPVSLFEVKVNY